jgi:hypothetical protein
VYEKAWFVLGITLGEILDASSDFFESPTSTLLANRMSGTSARHAGYLHRCSKLSFTHLSMFMPSPSICIIKSKGKYCCISQKKKHVHAIQVSAKHYRRSSHQLPTHSQQWARTTNNTNSPVVFGVQEDLCRTFPSRLDKLTLGNLIPDVIQERVRSTRCRRTFSSRQRLVGL